ncbi:MULTISPECIES: fimbrial biogenesis chaperone [Providencia]|uniref:Gram-negative pili assembly chaperone domain protein n=2 Tax=Providencia stuartii TaxID=588 RepID=A0AA86YYK2_PROST|nr:MULTISPECIES: molecular chaperone [Providencia]AFH94413.1 pili assembly chaperone [Providencia stuartii MRSN 2154]AVE42102.1 molecular chaperone [Providencia stuartii]EDU60979.1 gram-negative pili assembly chaperone domain protein [Providencia stuartii ATCC 25827]EMF0917853.1 molecular chaperone [Providencia stuartii]MBN5556126.1 molecular chaperone [Providencia stuartii]
MNKLYKGTVCLSFVFISVQTAFAAINIDRTRIIFPGQDKSVSLVINNQSKTLPYLAQSWMEDDKGNKIAEPFTVLPPMQRVEPNTKNQIKIIKTEAIDKLPQDRESLFYLNVREIPPVSNKENVVQIAIQSRLKMFYRPAQIENNSDKVWAKELKYTHSGNRLLIENPTKYYVTLGYLSSNTTNNFPDFESVMIAPMSKESVTVPTTPFKQLYTGYMDDYGGMKMLTYQCAASVCQLANESK